MVIKDNDGKLFLTLRDIRPYKGLWHLPGGAVRFKETIAEAVNRIAIREFGCGAEIMGDIGYCETINDDLAEDDKRHSNSVVVVVRILGTPVTTKESAQVGYFDTLPKNMHPYHREFIKRKKVL